MTVCSFDHASTPGSVCAVSFSSCLVGLSNQFNETARAVEAMNNNLLDILSALAPRMTLGSSFEENIWGVPHIMTTSKPCVPLWAATFGAVAVKVTRGLSILAQKSTLEPSFPGQLQHFPASEIQIADCLAQDPHRSKHDTLYAEPVAAIHKTKKKALRATSGHGAGKRGM